MAEGFVELDALRRVGTASETRDLGLFDAVERACCMGQMRRVFFWSGVTVAVLLGLAVVAVVLAALGVGGGRLRLPVERAESFEGSVELPALGVEGPALVTSSGQALRLRGIMPPDPAVLAGDRRFTAALFEEIAATGANLVRVPVHPDSWREDPDYLWRYLDPAVRWAGEAGLYVIIDWHSIGNVRTGAAPLHPDMYSHTEALTHEFWTATAAYFADAPNVMFEVFNEPQGITPGEWRAAAEDIVRVIRTQGAEQPVVVGGTEYARDLSWVLDDPVDDPAVVYASHIYPSHAEASWPRYFGDVAERYPVLLTEWGFATTPPPDGQDFLVGTESGYARPLMDYAEKVGAGWVACWWDDEWQPAMLRPGDQGVGEFGQFVLDELATS